jgi:S-adenosylmethionine hydrolase
MPRPIVTLTTDFGTTGSYVAQMKGVLLGVNPELTIVDITHKVPPQNIRAGAMILAEAAIRFPPQSIHVAVVDPGVGTKRNLIYASMADRHFLAPDNGLLSLLAREFPPVRIIKLANAEYWRSPVSATFHGRDILAPVAAHLSLGVAPDLFGTPLDAVQMLDWPRAAFAHGNCSGEVMAIDAFGNVITNISVADLPQAAALQLERAEAQIAGHVIVGISRTYGEKEPGQLLALFGSSGYLEVAVNQGHAASVLSAQPGDPIAVRWPDANP